MFENGVLLIVQVGCLALQAWALIDCITRRGQTFVSAQKLSKPAWLAITAIAGLLTFYFGVISILGIAGLVGSIVYLVDVRPAVREISGGRW